MSYHLTISDTLYNRLEATMRRRGLGNIEQLLEEWQADEDDRLYRQNIVRQIDNLRERLFRQYGQMTDSVSLIRADREQ